jgi:sec-independent protein translocase protein TatA
MWSDIFRGPGWIIILVLVLLLFGAPRLPALARSMGQSMKIFRTEVKTRDEEPDAETVADLENDNGASGAQGSTTPTKPKK